MASIQFRGLGQVLTAFENRGVEAWSLWDGKAFMFKGVGQNDLTTILESLDKGGTTAIYTLKVYEDITDAKKIKSSTECDGSFNFRLYEREGEFMSPHNRSFESTRALEERMNQFEERILNILENNAADNEEEKPADLMGTITGLLQDPDKLGKIINLGKSLLGLPVQPAYVGNVNKLSENAGNGGSSSASLSPSIKPTETAAPAGENFNIVTEQVNQAEYEARVNRLGVAINTLEQSDNKIVEHLEKLASIAVNKPDQFKMLIGMLDMY